MAADPLAKACQLAFEVAREGVETDPPVDPPAPMRSFLYVAQLPPRAVSVAQRVLDDDPQFRARVAAVATQESVGEPGYLWLTRPAGWATSYSALTGSNAPSGGARAVASAAVPPPPPAPEGVRSASVPAVDRPAPPVVPEDLVVASPTATPDVSAAPASDPFAAPAAPSVASATPEGSASSEDIETELSSLRNLVDQLAEERENVTVPVAGAVVATSPASSPVAPVVATPAPAPAAPTPTAPAPAPTAGSGGAPVAEASSLTRQLDALTADLRRARTERDDALTEKESSISRQILLEEELNSVRAQTLGASEKLTELEADRQSLELSLSESQTTVTELESRLAADETENTEVAARIDGITRERDNAWQENASITSERDELAAQAKVAEQARIDLEAELADVSAKWQDAQVQLASANEQRTTLETEAAELRGASAANVQERNALVNSMSSNLQQVETERDLIAAKLQSAEQQLAATRTAVDQANATIGTELGLAEAAVAEAVQGAGSLDNAVKTTAMGVSEIETAPVAPVSVDTTTNVDATADVTEPAVDSAAAQDSSAAEDSAAASDSAESDEDVSVFGTASPVVVPAAPSLPSAVAAADVVESDAPEEVTAEPESSEAGSTNEPDTMPVPHQAGFVSDVGVAGTGNPTAPELPDSEDHADNRVGGVSRQQVPPMSGDPVSIARHAVSTPDIVVLIHGDPVALLGWPTLDVAARRDALVSYLGDLAAETGAAPDVVFDGLVGDETALPTSRVVRVRLTNADVDAAEAIAPLVDSYPKQWPVAVVTDAASLAATVKDLGASVVENGHMLDLFIAS